MLTPCLICGCSWLHSNKSNINEKKRQTLLTLLVLKMSLKPKELDRSWSSTQKIAHVYCIVWGKALYVKCLGCSFAACVCLTTCQSLISTETKQILSTSAFFLCDWWCSSESLLYLEALEHYHSSVVDCSVGTDRSSSMSYCRSQNTCGEKTIHQTSSYLSWF